jgi:alpha-galactosidase
MFSKPVFGALQVWAGPLSNNRVVVSMWNKCRVNENITAWWVDIGLKSNDSMVVRDLWEVMWFLTLYSVMMMFEA